MLTLIFIYNAKSGALDKVFDYAHKLIKPSTYSCDLCMLTHHNFGERSAWQQFKQSNTVDLVFWHKDDTDVKTLSSALKEDLEFPVILSKEQDSVKPFMTRTDIAACTSVEELITRIELRLKPVS